MGSAGVRTILLITNYPASATEPKGGRELLCVMNHAVLRQIYGDRLGLFYLPPRQDGGLLRFVASLRGHLNGVNRVTLRLIVSRVREQGVAKVFIDGSNLGPCARILKKQCPNVEIATFFHNVEARFFTGALTSSRSLRAVGVLATNYFAEWQAVRHSNKIICLSDRDSELLRSIYGRPATHISSMAVLDQLSEVQTHPLDGASRKFALFVGGVFYANLQGIRWFIKHVLARVNLDLCIVGRGFEKHRNDLEQTGQVRVIGGVDNLADWYRRCAFIVAPIFDGSGMKTKVAEALMFGKRIVGTPEAFSGYENLGATAGWVCNTPSDFIRAIDLALAADLPAFDPQLRSLYERNYSFEAAKRRLAGIVGPLPNQDDPCAA